jgi:peptide chain release factor subunit 3
MNYDPNMYNNPYGGMYDPNFQQMNYQNTNMNQMQNNNYYQQGYQQNQNYGQYQHYQQNYNTQPQQIQQLQNQQNQTQQNQQNQTQQAKPAPKGIAGLPGAKVSTAKTTTNTNVNSNQQNKANVKPTVQANQTKPGTAQGKKEEKKVAPVKKEVKKEEKKDDKKDIDEITKNVDNINIEIEQNLVDDSKEGQMIEVDTTRTPVNLIFIGHVDAGKSTISGSILLKTGMIDERTIEKYQRLAKANNRESWFMAYITDETEEERERGKTVEVGKAFFNTPSKRYTILDAPGHASYVPNMLMGACQADFAGLVISAKNGEFESGFEGEGRTREHALLAKSLGVTKLVVIINKMDEESVKWSKDRYDQIKKDLSVFLKQCGYNIEKHVYWIPISGLKGENLAQKVESHVCPWYDGPTLLEILDKLETPDRREDAAVRIPIMDRYKDQGIYLLGKIESGIVKYGATYTIMPSKLNFEVGWLFNSEEKGVPYAKPGECVRVNNLIYNNFIKSYLYLII